MTGGLIQLVTTGIQDSPIIGNPEITFFKTVYRQHTMFSLCQNDRFIGNLEFEKKGSKTIEKNGDLLYNQYFKLEIPYFEIVKSVVDRQEIDSGYNINQLDVTYMNTNCVVVYAEDNWYIIPENLFNLSFDKVLFQIESTLLIPNLLPEYIKEIDIGHHVTLYQIDDNQLSSIISILRVNSNYWEQLWLNIASTTADVNYFSNLVTVNSSYNNLYQKYKFRIFTVYYIRNFFEKNINSFDFNQEIAGECKNEIQRYLEYVNNIDFASQENQKFDIDTVYQYCKNNFLKFEDYRDLALPYNSLIILIMFNLIFSSTDNIFSFWKKYNLGEFNNIETSDDNIRDNNEWNENLNNLVLEYLPANIKNQILDTFKMEFNTTQDKITEVFTNTEFANTKNLYIKLKNILSRFYQIPYYQLNYNDFYLATKYTDDSVIEQYNNDNYIQTLNQEIKKYPELESVNNKLNANEMENITPVDLLNIYGIVTEEMITEINSLTGTNKAITSFLILWKNSVYNILYKRYLDTYLLAKNNAKLYDYSSTRLLTLYYSIYPKNTFSYQDFLTSFNSMFYKNSWMGNYSIDNNTFLKFKENIFDVKINEVDIPQIKTTETSPFIDTNNNFHKLEITNTYNYTFYDTIEQVDNYNKFNFKDVIYNYYSNYLAIKFDNNFIKSDITKITLKIRNRDVFYSSINNKILENEKNFKTLYLVFDKIYVLENGEKINIVPENGNTINLAVTYQKYLPTISFYKNSIQYPKINSNKFYLINKFPNNEPNINNIYDGNQILIDTTMASSKNIKILTTNYLNNSLFYPSGDFNLQAVESSINSFSSGFYVYGISYYGKTENNLKKKIIESNMGNQFRINLNSNQIVQISNIPISDNAYTIGRRIYRTKANDTKFLLLVDIPDNSTTNFVDDINDDKLGLEYDFNSNIKYNYLPNPNDTVTKQLVQIVKKGELYQVQDLNGQIINFPIGLNDVSESEGIKEIYIEELEIPMDIINYNDFKINTNGTVVFKNQSDFSTNYFYYLVNPSNYKDSYKLAYSKYSAQFQSSTTKPNLPFNYTVINNLGNLTAGVYTYKISFYNTNTFTESLPSSEVFIIGVLNNDEIIINELPPIYDSNYNSWKLYRTESNGSTFYLVDIINRQNVLSYIDTKSDVKLKEGDKYQEPFLYLTSKINKQLINKPGTIPLLTNTNQVGNIQPGLYKYSITYYNVDINNEVSEETIGSNASQILITTNTQININLPISSDQRVTGRKIYRTKSNENNFYLLANIPNNIDATYIDNKHDSDLDINKTVPEFNMKEIKYSMLKISNENITPNLNSFISHSTDHSFVNDKGMSDLNDYLFNKPFLMMVNTESDNIDNELTLKQSFQTSNLYFYNIDFKINDSSIIMLDDIIVNYLVPLSSQTFFKKENSDNYYQVNFETNKLDKVENYQISKLNFNPAFDEVNLTNVFLNYGYYSNFLIDLMYGKLDIVFTNNPDYKTTIDLIENTNQLYMEIFNKVINVNYNNNRLYGSSSRYYLEEIYSPDYLLNKLTVLNDKMVPWDLLSDLQNNNNYDFIKFTHNAIKIIDDESSNSDITKLSYKSTVEKIKLLDPVYYSYVSGIKVSDNYQKYLWNVSKFFISFLNYIKDNIDYLNYSNPNNYQEEFLSSQEIQQHKYNNFYDYNDQTVIDLLHPMIDNNIHQINVIEDDKITKITDFKLNVDYDGNKLNINQIATNPDNNEYATCKLENKYNDSLIKTQVKNEFTPDKFNYLGIININSNGEFVFNDSFVLDENSKKFTYYQLDDKDIYRACYKNPMNMYNIDSKLKDQNVINPIELIINSENDNLLELTNFSTNQYLYVVNIKFKNKLDDIYKNQIYDVIGLIDINVTAIKVIFDNDSGAKVYLQSNLSSINFVNKYLVYVEPVSLTVPPNISWTYIDNEIISWSIQTYKKYNFFTSNSSDGIFELNSKFYTDSHKLTINGISGYNGTYYYFSDDQLKLDYPVINIDDNKKTSDPVEINKYLIENKKLYYGTEILEEEKWVLVITQQQLDYYIQEKLINENFNDNNYQYYEIYINGKLNSPQWVVLFKDYIILKSSNQTYNKALVFINYKFEVEVVKYFENVIDANEGKTTDTVINGQYIIENKMLYLGVNSVWEKIKSGKYYIKSKQTSYDSKYMFINPFENLSHFISPFNKSINNLPNKNEYVEIKRPSMNIENNYIYSYYKNYDFTKNISQLDDDCYTLLIDLSTTPNRHFMLKIKDVINKQIPRGNYQCWVITTSELNMLSYSVNNVIVQDYVVKNISGIPEYSYYLIKSGENSCIYYYQEGTTMEPCISEPINYYPIQNANISEIYLIDNGLFNKDANQLVKISYLKNGVESFISKKILKGDGQSDFKLNDPNGLSYDSEYVVDQYQVKYSSDSVVSINGDNEFIYDMILKSKSTNRTFLYPIFIKYYEPVTLPDICYRIDESTWELVNPSSNLGVEYKGYLIPINSDNIIFGEPNNSTFMNDFYFAKISKTAGYKYYSLTPFLEVIGLDDNYDMLVIKKGYDLGVTNYKFTAFKIQIITSDNKYYNIYIRLFVTSNSITSLIPEYLSVLTDPVNKISVKLPIYSDQNGDVTIPNLALTHTILSDYPTIMKTDGNDFVLVKNDIERAINYNYWVTTRHLDIINYNHQVKQLNFNSIINTKPSVELWSNINTTLIDIKTQTNVYNNAKIFIVSYKNKNLGKQMYAFTKSEFDSVIGSIGNTFSDSVSLFFSIYNPTFVCNHINLIQKDDTNFEIQYYDKLFLEMGEIIMIENNYFYVDGLNVFGDKYELKLIRTLGTITKFIYNGYYTFGNYLSKENRRIPELNYQNVAKYYNTKKLNPGDIYFNNQEQTINICNQSIEMSNISIFDDLSLKIKLLYNSGNLYMFDNFVKLKLLDRIVYYDPADKTNHIYQIKNLRDGQVYLNKEFNHVVSNNSYLEFILPYQPFETKYIHFDANGSILSSTISDNKTILLDNQDNSSCFIVTNNKINHNFPTNTWVWCRIWNTDYVSSFENSMYIPNNISLNNINFNDNFPIEIKTTYDSTTNEFKITNYNNTLISSKFAFYYLQPVQLAGTFNYIISIKTIGNEQYLKLANEINIKNSINNVDIKFSPIYSTEYEYYSNLKIKYNFGIQSHDYNKLSAGKEINVVRYALKNDNLIFIQTLNSNNAPLTFIYGKSIRENEILNNIGNASKYENIYFYNYMKLNDNGTISNLDTLYGSYHLLIETVVNEFDYVHLVKYVYPNNIKLYTNKIKLWATSYFQLNKVIPVKVSPLLEIIYENIKLIESKKIFDLNYNQVQIVKNYNIKLIGVPQIQNEMYKQKISFITDSVNTNIYQKVYLDEKLSQDYLIEYVDSNYYIISKNYLGNSYTSIYTVNNNYLTSAQRNKTIKNKNFKDNQIEYFIDTDIIDYEFLTHPIKISKINPEEFDYKYKLQDDSNNFNLNERIDYRVFGYSGKIQSINNSNRTISLTAAYDDDTLEISKDYVDIPLIIYNSLDTSIAFNPSTVFNDVKQLKMKLLTNSVIKDYDIYNYLKPWKSWSILNAINKVPKLKELVNDGYVGWDSINEKPIFNKTINGQYLTNDELNRLNAFISSINQSDKAKTNYLLMKDQIEKYILDNVIIWLNNPTFFLNAKSNIDIFLANSPFEIEFDGTNIIFLNDPKPTYININGVNEIASYLTNEFTYDSLNNTVRRTNQSFNKIENQLVNWINKVNSNDMMERSYGTSIHQLLRYLTKLGDDLNNLMKYLVQPFVDVPQYVYNNPIKFLINKVWEKYNDQGNLNLLDKEFNTDLSVVYDFTKTSNTYSSINYLQNLNIAYTGLFSMNWYNYFNHNINEDIAYFKIYENLPYSVYSIDTEPKLMINPLFPYKINFSNKQVKSNSTYGINFLNGQTVSSDIKISQPNKNPDQLTFNSEYNIKPDEFLVVNETSEYKITESILRGKLYKLKFNLEEPNSQNYIDKVNFRGFELTVINNNLPDGLRILIPFDINYNQVEQNDLFELVNLVSIKTLKTKDKKQYLEFYNSKFNYISGQSMIRTSTHLYILQKDNLGYYVLGDDISSRDAEIITTINPSHIEYLYRILIQYKTDPIFEEKGPRPDTINPIVPLEFKIISNPDEKTNNIETVQPHSIYKLGDDNLIFYYTDEEYNDKIKNLTWDKIIQNKKMDQDVINRISNITFGGEYLYYATINLPLTTMNESTEMAEIFIYNSNLNSNPNDTIDTDNGIYQPVAIDLKSVSEYKINHQDDSTYFAIERPLNQTDLLSGYKFIQKNWWKIVKYVITGSQCSIEYPNNFVLSTGDKFYYKFGNQVIDRNSFISSSGQLIFELADITISGEQIFAQYYIENEENIILIPDQNKSVTITFDYPYQYDQNINFYMIPYTGYGKEFDNNLYKLKTFETTIKSNGFESGYEGTIDGPDQIILYSDGQVFVGKIFDKYFENGDVYYIISLAEQIDTTKTFTYNLKDNIVKKVKQISYYQETLLFGSFIKQEELHKIKIFTDDTINSYQLSAQHYLSEKANRFYLVSYSDFTVTNLFNNYEFVQNNEMKKQITYQYIDQGPIIEAPNWKRVNKLFEYIRFYFNDQLMEQLNEDVYKIHYFLYCNEETRRKSDNMTKFRFNDQANKWELYLPLIFWFAGKPGLSIPTVALPHTELRLEYKLNNIAHVLNNDLSGNFAFSKKPHVKISLVSDFILLDTLERKLFGSYSHEYIVDRYKTYSNNHVNKETVVLNKRFEGLIKDIHMVTHPINHPDLNYIPVYQNNYDVRYQHYVTAKNYYNLYIQNNEVYTSVDQQNYSRDFEIIYANNNEFNQYQTSIDKTKSVRINKLISWFSYLDDWSDDLLKFLMYYEDYFLSAFKDKDSKRYTILTYYLTFMYSNKKTVKEISPIDYITIRAIGTDLFAQRDWSYYNSVIPYQKFKNSLPTGMYTYSFSLYPTEDQPSGHLNFTNFDDIVVKVISNPLVTDATNPEPYIINFVVKEYNILRIMSGIGGLAWIT